MHLFELVDLRSGQAAQIRVPEEMTIEDFTREIRCEMGLQYTVGSQYHLIIDDQNRVFMRDDAIETHVDMLWEGADDPNDPDHKSTMYREESYYPESQYTLHDLFPKIGATIVYGQDYDQIGCKLIGVEEEDECCNFACKI